MGWGNFQAEKLVGRTVVSCEVLSDVATLGLDDGTAARVALFGDCCSSSYFSPEGEEALRSLLGSKVQEVEDRNGASSAGLEDSDEWGTCVSWHFLVFVTDKGHVTVDWRNDSNGFYDGWATLVVE